MPALGSYVTYCPNPHCGLIAPTMDLTPCCECGAKYCNDCAVPTSDPDLFACSRACQAKANHRYKKAQAKWEQDAREAAEWLNNAGTVQ